MAPATQSVDASGDAPNAEQGTDPTGPNDATDAEEAMEAGHHWAPARALDNHRLDVHDAIQ